MIFGPLTLSFRHPACKSAKIRFLLGLCPRPPIAVGLLRTAILRLRLSLPDSAVYEHESRVLSLGRHLSTCHCPHVLWLWLRSRGTTRRRTTTTLRRRAGRARNAVTTRRSSGRRRHNSAAPTTSASLSRYRDDDDDDGTDVRVARSSCRRVDHFCSFVYIACHLICLLSLTIWFLDHGLMSMLYVC